MIKVLARFKARQARGGAWIQIVMNMGIIAANVKLFQDYYEPFGISVSEMLVFGVILYLLGTIAIGYLDEQYGIWQYENEYNSNLNPFMVNIDKKLKEICEK